MKTLLLLALMLSTPAFADGSCGEKSLVHFFAGGHEIPSEVIGAADPCDQFGGNLVHSPKYGVYLYVNFNIPGTIDLDALDATIAASKHAERVRIELAVVDAGWIERHYQDTRDAILSFGGDTLFISEKVLAEGRFNELMHNFYNLD